MDTLYNCSGFHAKVSPESMYKKLLIEKNFCAICFQIPCYLPASPLQKSREKCAFITLTNVFLSFSRQNVDKHK